MLKSKKNCFFLAVLVGLAWIFFIYCLFPSNNFAQAAIGQPCSTGVLCDVANGEVCDSFGTKTCMKEKQAGLKCKDNDGLCGNGTYCDHQSGYCVTGSKDDKTKDLYGSCASSPQCKGELWCVQGVCNAKSAKDIEKNKTTCTTSADCSTPTTKLFCQNGLCTDDVKTKTLEAGANCAGRMGIDEDSHLCKTGTICLTYGGSIRCYNIGNVGGSCETGKSAQCASGLSCDSSKTCRKSADSQCQDTNDCPRSGDLYYACKPDPKDATKKTCQVITSGNEGTIGNKCVDPDKNGKGTCKEGNCTDERCMYSSNQAPGSTCESGKQCSSGQCENGKCAQGTGGTTPQTIGVDCSKDPGKRGYFTNGLSNACINCGECNVCDIMNVFTTIIDSLLGLVGLLAVAATVFAGFKYITGGQMGDKDKIAAGKQALTMAVKGLVIALVAYAFVNTIMNVLGAQKNLGISNNASWFAPSFQCRQDAWKWSGWK